MKSSDDQFSLVRIAMKMRQSQLPEDFVVECLKTAFLFEGVSDLMHLWEKASIKNNIQEQTAIEGDLLDMCRTTHEVVIKTYSILSQKKKDHIH